MENGIKPLFQSDVAFSPASPRRQRRLTVGSNSTGPANLGTDPASHMASSSSVSLPHMLSNTGSLANTFMDPALDAPSTDIANSRQKRWSTLSAHSETDLAFEDFRRSSMRPMSRSSSVRSNPRPPSVPPPQAPASFSSIDVLQNPHWVPVYAPEGFSGQMALVSLSQLRGSLEMPRPQLMHDTLGPEYGIQARVRTSCSISSPPTSSHSQGEDRDLRETEPKNRSGFISRVKRCVRRLLHPHRSNKTIRDTGNQNFSNVHLADQTRPSGYYSTPGNNFMESSVPRCTAESLDNGVWSSRKQNNLEQQHIRNHVPANSDKKSKISRWKPDQGRYYAFPEDDDSRNEELYAYEHEQLMPGSGFNRPNSRIP